jgi:peptidoglycan hydrolase-like protein with peptidoglycan-binding domain
MTRQTSKTSFVSKALITAGVLGTAWLVWKASQGSPVRRHLVSQGEGHVREAQRLLKQLGYDVRVDGLEGHRTRDAVQHFQSLHDLDIDGEINGATLMMLHAAVSSYTHTGFGPMASGALTPASIGS